MIHFTQWKRQTFATLQIIQCPFKVDKEAMKNVEYDCITLVEWLHHNYFTLDKCHLLASGYKNEDICLSGSATLWEENVPKLLGLNIDSGEENVVKLLGLLLIQE